MTLHWSIEIFGPHPETGEAEKLIGNVPAAFNEEWVFAYAEALSHHENVTGTRLLRDGKPVGKWGKVED